MQLALHLVYTALQNDPIPERLPLSLVPPEKRVLLCQAGTRSDELHSTHPRNLRKSNFLYDFHYKPNYQFIFIALTWSSRASSVASLNIQQQPSQSPPTVSKNNTLLKRSLFERDVEEWQVENLNQFEVEFADLDKDHDGFVSGNDVRDSFLR